MHLVVDIFFTNGYTSVNIRLSLVHVCALHDFLRYFVCVHVCVNILQLMIISFISCTHTHILVNTLQEIYFWNTHNLHSSTQIFIWNVKHMKENSKNSIPDKSVWECECVAFFIFDFFVHFYIFLSFCILLQFSRLYVSTVYVITFFSHST